MKKSKNSSFILLEIICIFSLGVFFSKGFDVVGILFPLVFLFKVNLIKSIDVIIVKIILFSVTYTLFLLANNLIDLYNGNVFMHFFYPTFFYLIGTYISSKKYNYMYIYICTIVFFTAIPSISLIFKDIYLNGFLNISRIVYDGKEEFLVATLHGVNLSLGLTFIGLIFYRTVDKTDFKLKLIFIIFSIICLVCNLHLLNRTAFYIVAFSILSQIVLSKFYNILKYIIGLILVFTVISNLKIIKYDELFSYYENRSNFESENNVLLGDRLTRWNSGINSLISNPFGGGVYNKDKRYYAHNFWLDIGEMAGIIPFFLIVNITFNYYKRIIRTVVNYNFQINFTMALFILINIGIIIVFFVEPIYEGSPQYVYMFFLIMGMFKTIEEKKLYKIN